MKTIKVKSIEVPIQVMTQVADVIKENGLPAEVMGSSEEFEDTVVIEFSFEKEEREAVQHIESIIEDFHDDNDDEENDENED